MGKMMRRDKFRAEGATEDVGWRQLRTLHGHPLVGVPGHCQSQVNSEPPLVSALRDTDSYSSLVTGIPSSHSASEESVSSVRQVNID